MKNNNIRALANKLFHHKRGVRRIKLMHPKRDWAFGLLVGLVIMITMAGWSAYVYFNQREDISLDNHDIKPEVPLYKADLVAEALTVFSDRAQRFADLNSASGVTSIGLDVSVIDDGFGTSSATTTPVTTDTSNATSTTEVLESAEIAPDTQIDQSEVEVETEASEESEERVGTSSATQAF